MRKSLFTEQQIIGFLKQAETGLLIKDICRQGGFSEPTFYKWRAKYGGMEADEAHRLKDLEVENARLKKLLAQAHSYHRHGTAALRISLRARHARAASSPAPTTRRCSGSTVRKAWLCARATSTAVSKHHW